ncbi:MAG: flagellar hook-associated protein FlgL [Actinomycetota bacterium]|nr:flagellar hook-associated protein FlgL [Actinomycetota bacterium]
MRVTNKMVQARILTNLNSSMGRLNMLQNQLSTGKLFSSPSEDPIAAAQSLSIKSIIKDIEQYQKNINSATAWIDIAETSMSDVVSTVQKSREIAVAGASGTASADDREALAKEVDQLLEGLVTVANTSYGGKYIFAGFRTTAEPFAKVGDPITSVAYNGDGGEILYETESGIKVAVNIPGSEIFGGPNNSFNALIDLRDHLLAGNTAALTADIGLIDQALEQVQDKRSIFGARANRLEAADNRLTDRMINLKKLLAKTEDIDMAEVIMNLKMEENVYQAALAAGSRVMQMSLLDYLK